jgi:hypothetical protein
MAKAEFNDPVEIIRGKLNKRQKDIYRIKSFRSPTGAVVMQGPQEVYRINHPRDYDLSPVTPNEKAHQDMFKQACQMAALQLLPDAPERPLWVKRFDAQLSKPEALDPTKPPKRYGNFRAFVRTAIFFQLKYPQ